MKIRAASILIALLPAIALAQTEPQVERPAPRPAHAGDERPQTKPGNARTKPDNPPEKAPPAPPVEPPQTSDAAPPAPPVQPSQPSDPAPPAAPAQPAEVSGPPAHTALRESDFDYSACLLQLSLLGADYRELPAISDADNADCGIDRPIQLKAPLPGIEIRGGAPMRCDTARHLAHWLRDFARPAAALLPGQPRIVSIEPGSTYQCRDTVGNGGGKMSEHALGNAFDIAAFGLQDGSRIEVTPRTGDGDLTEAFQKTLRASACLHFTTVLGPGANAAHDNHLHLDIKDRKGGYRLCQ